MASIEPLQIHLFGDGLVRLCTSQYEPPIPDNFASAKMHLTNFAINKKSKNFVKSSAEDEGSKRSIASWLRSMSDEGHDSEVRSVEAPFDQWYEQLADVNRESRIVSDDCGC